MPCEWLNGGRGRGIGFYLIKLFYKSEKVTIEGFSQILHSANRHKASLEMLPFLKSQNFNYGATVLLLVLPSIRELIFSCQKTFLTVWSAFSPCLIQQATVLKLRKSVWPSVFKELFSLEEDECFYNNNWTLMFLMLLSDLDCSGLFLNCAFVLWFLSISWIE